MHTSTPIPEPDPDSDGVTEIPNDEIDFGSKGNRLENEIDEMERKKEEEEKKKNSQHDSNSAADSSNANTKSDDVEKGTKVINLNYAALYSYYFKLFQTQINTQGKQGNVARYPLTAKTVWQSGLPVKKIRGTDQN